METLQISSFVHISNEKPLLPYSTPPFPSTYSILVIVICFASRSLVRPFASPRSPIVARRSLLVAIIAAKEKKKSKKKTTPAAHSLSHSHAHDHDHAPKSQTTENYWPPVERTESSITFTT